MAVEQHKQVAGLDTWVIHDDSPTRLTVVFLHGYAMQPADLTPFAHSLAIPGTAFVFPRGPDRTASGGYSWWAIDEDARAAALAGGGARDFAVLHPPGRAAARQCIAGLLAELRAVSAAPVLLAGFSQGGMLACDAVLMDAAPVAALGMLSASRVAADEWEAHRDRADGLPVFVSHGHDDPDLSFAAGEALRFFLERGGARVTWVPFAGGHEMPFRVWRELRHFIHHQLDQAAVLKPAAVAAENSRSHGSH